ncbi:MAG: type II toxin-antitoxin system HicB family antitoxin [Chitinophagaceae bacterium]|jgi:predicted RNase H-like HicB family nuclease|nr:type II toxin-antitoxin system HicB family antitoxin [Chitinophagaceae bacterium]
MRKYLVVYEKTKTGYSAYVPDLNGVVATGKTRAIVGKNIYEAVQFHIEGMKLKKNAYTKSDCRK